MTTADTPIDPTPSLASAKRWTWVDVVMLVLLLALALIIRIKWTDAAPSFDELWHLKSTVGNGSQMSVFAENVLYTNPPRLTSTIGAPPFWHVWTGMDGVLHPPLHILQLRLWRDLFGESDTVAHANSTAWSLVAVVFLFATMRLAMGRWCGMLGSLAFIASPTQIYFAQEIRGYQMLIALGAIALWVMTRIALYGPTRARALWLAFIPVPMLLTHYFAFGAVLAIGAYGLFALKGFRRTFLIAVTSGAIFYAAAWLPFALRQLGDLGTGDQFLRVTHVDLVQEASQLATAPYRLLIDRDFQVQPAGLAFGLLFLLPWLLARRAPWMLPWAMMLCGSLFVLVALDLARSTNHLGFTRYLAAASPAVLPLFVGCVWSISRPLAHVAGVTLAFMTAIFLYSGTGIANECDSFGSLASELEKRMKPGEAIVAYHGELPPFYGDVFLLTCSHSPTLFPKPIMRITGPIPSQVASTLPRSVWLISGRLDVPAEQVIPGARALEEKAVAFGVTITHLELAPELGTRS